MSRGAVIDLGSNSFKLLLAEQQKSCLIVHRESAYVTRLGEGVARTGKLSRDAMRRSLDVLRDYARAIDDFDAEKRVVLGTSALRLAKNRDIFIKQAKKLLGSSVRIVSEKMEGELAYAGLLSHPKWRSKQIIQLDLGGGSLEVIHAHGSAIHSIHSLLVGCVRLRDLFLKRQPLRAFDLARAALYLNEQLTPLRKLKLKDARASRALWVASGGSSIMLARVMNALGMNEKLKAGIACKEGCALQRPFLEDLLDIISSMDLDEVRALPAMPRDRADLAASALLVYVTLMRLLNVEKLRVSWRGLRHGAWNKWICSLPYTQVIQRDS